MAGDAQAHGIGMATHDGGLGGAHLSWWFRQAGLVAGEARLVAREGDIQLADPGHGAQAGRDRPLERFGGSFLLSGFGLAVGGSRQAAFGSVQLIATFTALSGSSCAKQR